MTRSIHDLAVRTVLEHVFGASTAVWCFAGILWLTRKGDPVDYVLAGGESGTFPPGKWLIEALTDAKFELATNRAK